MKTATPKNLLILTLLAWLISSCASMQPLSNYARSGDTVSLALGGTIDANAQVSVLKKDTITITITDSAGVTSPVMLRYLFRTYADPASAIGYRSYPVTNWLPIEAYPEPYTGQWIAIIDLTDPVSLTPVPLAVGTATISVSSPDLIDFIDRVGLGWTWTDGNLASIPIEILPGAGSSNSLNYLSPISADPSFSLEPIDQIEVLPQGVPSNIVGGGEFSFSYRHDDFNIQAHGIRVVPTTPDPTAQLAYSRTDQGDGTTLLKVTVTNPNGFLQTNVHDIKIMSGMSPFRSLGFILVWDDPNGQNIVDDANWQTSIQMLTGSYVDIDGAPMPELTPTMTKVN